MRPNGAIDGQQVYIPVLLLVSILGTEEAKLNEYRISSFERSVIFSHVCKYVVADAILSRKANIVYTS